MIYCSCLENTGVVFEVNCYIVVLLVTQNVFEYVNTIKRLSLVFEIF